MVSRVISALLVIGSSWILLQNCSSNPSGQLRARISSQEFRDFLDESAASAGSDELPSLSIGVAVGDQIILERSYGWADREHKRRPTSTTLYPVGSVSKAFTATGIMLLVDRGELDLDAPANRYLGSSPLRSVEPYAEQVSVRHLLQMTGGIPHIWWHNWADRGRPSPTTDRFLQEYGMVVFPPGMQFFYSNLSYGILEQIIANVSGYSYERFMHNDVFLPLGMTSTRVVVGDNNQDVAVRYDPEVEGPLDYSFLFPIAAGGFSSTISDLLRFGISHLGISPNGHRALSDRAIDAMRGTDVVSDSYGLGFGVWDDGTGVTLVSANGSLWGGAATIRLVPSTGLVVAAATNTANHNVTDGVTREIIAYVMPDYGEKRKQLISSKNLRIPRNAIVAKLNAESQFRGTWTGRIVLPDLVDSKIQLAVDDSLTLFHGNYELQPTDVRVRNGVLRAHFQGDFGGLRLEEEQRGLTLYLRENTERLNGFLRVVTEGYSLPFGVVLEPVNPRTNQ